MRVASTLYPFLGALGLKDNGYDTWDARANKSENESDIQCRFPRHADTSLGGQNIFLRSFVLVRNHSNLTFQKVTVLAGHLDWKVKDGGLQVGRHTVMILWVPFSASFGQS